MGVTIHYEGRTKDFDKVKKIVEYVTFTAKNLGWEVIPIEEEGYVVYEPIVNVWGKRVGYFIDFYPKDKDVWGEIKKPSKRIGVIVRLPPPYYTENFKVTFYKDEDEWVWKGFTKTQVFSEKELPNLTAHQILVSMLLTIKKTWLPDLDIVDEGDYYVPLCKEERIKIAEKEISSPEYREKFINMEPFNFERLVENHIGTLRYINALVSALAESLPPGFGIETPGFKLKKEKKDEKSKNSEKKK